MAQDSGGSLRKRKKRRLTEKELVARDAIQEADPTDYMFPAKGLITKAGKKVVDRVTKKMRRMMRDKELNKRIKKLDRSEKKIPRAVLDEMQTRSEKVAGKKAGDDLVKVINRKIRRGGERPMGNVRDHKVMSKSFEKELRGEAIDEDDVLRSSRDFRKKFQRRESKPHPSVEESPKRPLKAMEAARDKRIRKRKLKRIK